MLSRCQSRLHPKCPQNHQEQKVGRRHGFKGPLTLRTAPSPHSIALPPLPLRRATASMNIGQLGRLRIPIERRFLLIIYEAWRTSFLAQSHQLALQVLRAIHAAWRTSHPRHPGEGVDEARVRWSPLHPSHENTADHPRKLTNRMFRN